MRDNALVTEVNQKWFCCQFRLVQASIKIFVLSNYVSVPDCFIALRVNLTLIVNRS